MRTSTIDDAQGDEEAAEEEQDEPMANEMGNVERDVEDLEKNHKTIKHHRICLSPVKEKGQGLEEETESNLKENSDNGGLLGLEENNFGFWGEAGVCVHSKSDATWHIKEINKLITGTNLTAMQMNMSKNR